MSQCHGLLTSTVAQYTVTLIYSETLIMLQEDRRKLDEWVNVH